MSSHTCEHGVIVHSLVFFLIVSTLHIALPIILKPPYGESTHDYPFVIDEETEAQIT